MYNLSNARRPPHIGSTAIVCALPPSSRHLLRAAPDAMTLAGAALGLSISQVPCRAATRGDHAALWLGPDEVLLLAPEANALEVSRALRVALGDMPYALVDIGHRQIGLEVRGPHAQTLLNAGCPLDLDIDVFTPAPALEPSSARPKSCCGGEAKTFFKSRCGARSAPMCPRCWTRQITKHSDIAETYRYPVALKRTRSLA